MNDCELREVPPVVDAILRDTREMGFSMASEPQTGSLLRTLAASKPGGRFLELGTGTGVATAWLLGWTRHHGSNPSTTIRQSSQTRAGILGVTRTLPFTWTKAPRSLSDRHRPPTTSCSQTRGQESLPTSIRRLLLCASAVCTSSTISCRNGTGPRDTRRMSRHLSSVWRLTINSWPRNLHA